jgi:hypothetical protein
MYENVLRKRMEAIAETFPDGEKVDQRTAASSFRLPYWEPLRPRSGTTQANYRYGLPKIATIPIVIVRKPVTGDDRVVVVREAVQHNPLYDYHYPSKAAMEHNSTGINNIDVNKGNGIVVKASTYFFSQLSDKVSRYYRSSRQLRCSL